MPPLLKTFRARSFTPIKKLALLSKSERFFGLGAGLKRKYNVEDSVRTSGKPQAMDIKICMFSEKGLEEGDLHQI